jgi:hypothetical protein
MDNGATGNRGAVFFACRMRHKRMFLVAPQEKTSPFFNQQKLTSEASRPSFFPAPAHA